MEVEYVLTTIMYHIISTKPNMLFTCLSLGRVVAASQFNGTQLMDGGTCETSVNGICRINQLDSYYILRCYKLTLTPSAGEHVLAESTVRSTETYRLPKHYMVTRNLAM